MIFLLSSKSIKNIDFYLLIYINFQIKVIICQTSYFQICLKFLKKVLSVNIPCAGRTTNNNFNTNIKL